MVYRIINENSNFLVLKEMKKNGNVNFKNVETKRGNGNLKNAETKRGNGKILHLINHDFPSELNLRLFS